MPQSTAVKLEEEQLKRETAPTEQLTEDEIKQQQIILARAHSSRILREQNHREFDGMTYMRDYQANLDASISYLQPKINDDDVRVNTATTEKKTEAMLNELLSMNIQPEVHSFDRFNKEVAGLGKDFEHLVIQTNTIEREDDFLVAAYRELLTQRALFVRERYVERTVLNGAGQKSTTYCAEKRVVPGTKIFLGNIYLPAYRFKDQPFYIEYDRLHKREAEMLFGNNKNWEKVKSGGKMASELKMDDLYTWRLADLAEDEMEILCYYSYPDNEYQIYVNSIPMLPPGTPLPWKHEGYDMTMIVVKEIRTDFAYGKPPLASAKTLQALENEVIRNLIRKFRQSIEPPMVSSTNFIFTREMFSAGAITQGVKKGDISPLMEGDRGLTQAEFAVYDLINKKTEEFIGVSNLFQGLGNSQDRKTATQTMEELRQAVKMLGLAVLAAMRLRRDMTYLRIYTIIENMTKPVGTALDATGQKVVKRYMEFTVPNVDLENGRRGKKIIKFMDRDLTEEEEESLYKVEEQQEKRGNLIRLRGINVNKLRDIPLIWFVTAQQKEREGSAANKVMFQEKIAQAAEIEVASQGQVRANWHGISEEMELVWGTRNLFQKTAPQLMPPGMDANADPEVKTEAQKLMATLDAQSGGGKGVPQMPSPQTMMEPARRASRG